MDATLAFLLAYGYIVLFGVVAAEQIGLPIPAVPVLLAVGALAGTGRMSAALALLAAVAASVPADAVWYELGRRRGARVLGLLCRVSLEPDSCVRRTETLFLRQGKRALVIAKFVPGLSTLAPPMAGMVGLSRAQFLLLDGAGALVWAGAWIGLGYAFSDALELIVARADLMGRWALGIAAAALALYIGAKFIQRRRFLRSLRIARITPEELRQRIDAGDGDVIVIDTRSPIDVNAVPYVIPGALWITAEDIDRRRAEIPPDKDVVVYCS